MIRNAQLHELATTTPAGARSFVRDELDGWTEHALVADAVLLVSELATIALVERAAPAARIGVARGTDGVRIEVTDHSHTDVPPPVNALDQMEREQGLGIVAALATEWGIAEHPDEHTVWFELKGSTNSGRVRRNDSRWRLPGR